MKKMQKLQPKINVIRDKYKKAKMDVEQRNKMNQEMMALYSAEGYNPMSGCLPMLLQMPILFAFYVISSAPSSCGTRLSSSGSTISPPRIRRTSFSC